MKMSLSRNSQAVTPVSALGSGSLLLLDGQLAECPRAVLRAARLRKKEKYDGKDACAERASHSPHHRFRRNEGDGPPLSGALQRGIFAGRDGEALRRHQAGAGPRFPAHGAQPLLLLVGQNVGKRNGAVRAALGSIRPISTAWVIALRVVALLVFEARASIVRVASHLRPPSAIALKIVCKTRCSARLNAPKQVIGRLTGCSDMIVTR
jgi:hypothetical protein